jgi:translocation and assembly module TamB
MRRFLHLLLALAAVLLLGALALWPLSQTDAVWTWGGHRLVDFARTRIHGEIEVREVKGNYLTGLTFRGITIRDRQGEVLRAAGLELRFSLWSFLKLQPVIARLALDEPHLTLIQYSEGGWNVSNFFRDTPPPPFTTLDFPQASIKGGEITLTRGGATQNYRDLDLQLLLTVLHPKQPDQAILVRRASLAGETPWGRLGLQTRFTYGSNLLNLLSLSVEAANRPLLSLAGEVRVNGAEPVCKLIGEVGPIPGAEMRRIWRHWPGTFDLGGKFQLAGTPEKMQVSAGGPLPQGEYSFQGQVGQRAGELAYDVSLDLKGVQPRVWAGNDGPWAKRLQDLPPLEVQLGLKGDGLAWPPKNFECSLLSRPFSYRAAKVEQLRLNFKGNGREQRLQGLLQGSFGEISAMATGPLVTDLSGQVKIQTQGFKPGDLGLPVEAATLLDGGFSGNYRFPASLSGDLEARGQLQGQPLKNLRAKLALSGPRLEIAQAQMQLGTLTAELKGAVDSQGVDLQGRADLALDGSWPLLPPGLKGRVSGEGAVKGPVASPQFTLQAQGQGLAYADFAWDKVSLKASGTGWPSGGGRLEIQGSGFKTPAGVFSQAAFISHGEGGKWQIRLTASSPQGLQAEALGSADLLARPLTLTLGRCRFTSPKVSAVNAGPVQVRFHPGLEIPPAVWRVNDGRLTLRAQTRDRELTASLEAVDLPAGLFSLKGVPLDGKVQGRLDLTGSLGQPAMQGQLTWGPGKWGDFSFRVLQSSLSYRDENLIIKGSVEEKAAGPRLVWDGRIPLRLSFSPWKWNWGERDLDFRVQGENTSLALLTTVSPEVQVAEGPLSISAQWQGPPGQPRVSGKVRWGEGRLQLRAAGKPFRLMAGEAALQGEKLVIPGVTLESGGTAHLRGAVTLAGFAPGQIEARAELQDFQALARGGSEAAGTGSVYVSGPWSAPVLKGRLLLSKASFRPAFFQTGAHPDIVLKKAPLPPTAKNGPGEAPAVWQNLQMDLALEAPGGAWVRDKRLQVQLAGTLRVRKEKGEPLYFAGALHSLKGTYELQGRPFKIERADIRFPGKPQGDVTLEGRASHEISGTTLVLIASGPATKPQVRMESIPPLPPQDQLAYLVFGRPAQSLSQEEFRSVGQQAVGIVGGISAQKFQEILGRDFPLVGNVQMRSGQSEGRQIVGVAKPITKDITVSFERKTSPLYRDDTNQVRLEYKVNKYLSLETQMGQRNSGGDVFFNWDF